MCGITGIIKQKKFELLELKHITDSLTHRGPDDAGYDIFNSNSHSYFCGLGQRRLSIVDLSQAGHQPMCNEDKRYWITFNGEIYNHLELKQDLLSKKHIFKSNTDTEVIIHGIEEYGISFINQLNGMFAFALWDNLKGELLLARDRFGQKPLYYSYLNNLLIFASEVKAIAAHPEFTKTLDLNSLSDYLQFEYLPQDKSIYKNVNKLLPGHYLIFNQNGKSINKYWDVNFDNSSAYNKLPENELCEILLEKFKKAVNYRLMSDVPLGVFLSGGVDSSVIVATLFEMMPSKNIKTFSMGFEEESFDESSYAQKVANIFNTDHHHQKLTSKSMLDILPEVIDKIDEPFADASIIPTYLLSKFTRNYVTVALGGDGGDELFAGYDPFLANYWAEKFKLLPKSVTNKIVNPLVNLMPVSEKNMSLDFKAKNFLKYVYESPVFRNQLWLGSFSAKEQKQLLNFSLDYKPLNLLKVPDNLSKNSSLLWHYQKYYLPEDILTKVDRASMMVSLEARTPFLDVEFAEFANSLSFGLKFKNITRKYIFKKAFENKLPKSILYRNKKGFGIPLTKWIKNDLKKEIEHYLSYDYIKKQDLFLYDSVSDIFKEHLNGSKDNRKQVWTLYMFQKWYEKEF
jgi:asparagine synthase (glutamine-hydrolysing)